MTDLRRHNRISAFWLLAGLVLLFAGRLHGAMHYHGIARAHGFVHSAPVVASRPHTTLAGRGKALASARRTHAVSKRAHPRSVAHAGHGLPSAHLRRGHHPNSTPILRGPARALAGMPRPPTRWLETSLPLFPFRFVPTIAAGTTVTRFGRAPPCFLS